MVMIGKPPKMPMRRKPEYYLGLTSDKVKKIVEKQRKTIFNEQRLEIYKRIHTEAKKGDNNLFFVADYRISPIDLRCLKGELAYKGFIVNLNEKISAFDIKW